MSGAGPPTPQTRRRFRAGRAAAAAYTPGHGLTLNCIVSPAPTTRRGFTGTTSSSPGTTPPSSSPTPPRSGSNEEVLSGV